MGMNVVSLTHMRFITLLLLTFDHSVSCLVAYSTVSSTIELFID
jgi:hypothetical protein